MSVFAYLSRNKGTHDILEDEDYISHILDVIKRFSLLCPPNKHYTTTANRMGRSIWVSGYFHHWPFTCYSWGPFFTHCSEKHEGVGSAVSPCSMAVWSGAVLSGEAARNISRCFRPNLLVVSLPQQFCVADPLHDVYLMLKRHLFESFLSSG